jgi:hypothetical protein
MATNRIDILDPALLRPGRIDRKIEFPNPDEGSRADILRIHSRKMNLVRGIDLKKVADRMTGASGAELKARRRGRHPGCARCAAGLGLLMVFCLSAARRSWLAGGRGVRLGCDEARCVGLLAWLLDKDAPASSLTRA